MLASRERPWIMDMCGFRKVPEWERNTAILFMVMLGLLVSFPSSPRKEFSAQRSAQRKKPKRWFTITANLVNEAVRFRKHVLVSWLQWAQCGPSYDDVAHRVATSSAPRPKQQPSFWHSGGDP